MMMFLGFFVLFCFVWLFRAEPVTYGSSQARSQIRAYITAHGNARSLTHRVRPGIKPASSWILVRFVTTELMGTPFFSFFWELNQKALLICPLCCFVLSCVRFCLVTELVTPLHLKNAFVK